MKIKRKKDCKERIGLSFIANITNTNQVHMQWLSKWNLQRHHYLKSWNVTQDWHEMIEINWGCAFRFNFQWMRSLDHQETLNRKGRFAAINAGIGTFATILYTNETTFQVRNNDIEIIYCLDLTYKTSCNQSWVKKISFFWLQNRQRFQCCEKYSHWISKRDIFKNNFIAEYTFYVISIRLSLGR